MKIFLPEFTLSISNLESIRLSVLRTSLHHGTNLPDRQDPSAPEGAPRKKSNKAVKINSSTALMVVAFRPIDILRCVPYFTSIPSDHLNVNVLLYSVLLSSTCKYLCMFNIHYKTIYLYRVLNRIIYVYIPRQSGG